MESNLGYRITNVKTGLSKFVPVFKYTMDKTTKINEFYTNHKDFTINFALEFEEIEEVK